MPSEKEWYLTTKVMANPQFRGYRPQLASFMARSRQLRRDPAKLLLLQADMASGLLAAQESKRRLEGELAAYGGDDASYIEQLRIAAAVAKGLAHVIKQIGDGIAWRALNYDRPVIYELSSKPQTGHLEFDSVQQEAALAAAHVGETGNTVVINDLTNFLRYGDFTSISDKSVSIAECKGGRGSSRSGRAVRQRQRLESTCEFLNAGVTDWGASVKKLFRYSIEPRSHLGAVAGLIREAKQKGSAHARLSRCLAVDVLHVESLLDMSSEKEMQKLDHNPFKQSPRATSHSSLDYFGTFSPNVAPYSVYPFSDEDCTDVMTGDILLRTHFNHRNLERCFKRRGLLVESPTLKQAQAFLDMDLGERRRHEDEIAILVGRPGDPYCVCIYLALLARLSFEFLDEETYADAVEEVLEQRDVGAILVPGFQNEALLWD